MTKVKQQLDLLSAKLLSIEASLSHIRSCLPFLLNAITEDERKEKIKRREKVGRYSLHQKVTWKENRNKTIHSGTIIGIVAAGKYPTDSTVILAYGTSLETLRYRGYYRYEESYLVQTMDGKIYWPRVASLTPTK